MSAGNKVLVCGHFSHNRMASHLKQSFSLPGLERDIKEFVPHVQSARKWVDHYYPEFL